MKRNDIEIGILNRFTKKVNEFGFELKKQNFKGERYAEYFFSKDSVNYVFTVLFVKNNFLEYGNYLSISYNNVTALYKKINLDFSEENWNVFNVSLNKYLHPANYDGFRNTGRFIEHFIDKELITEDKLDMLSENLFNTYFRPCINKIIPETDTIEKAERLINNVP